MARPKKKDSERLVLQGLRISPDARERLQALPTEQKKAVIAEMRRLSEMAIIAMSSKHLQTAQENNSFS
jgi:hypothetical protein